MLTGMTVFEQRRWPLTLPITHLQCSTQFSPHSSLGSPSLSNPHEVQSGQWLTSGPNDYKTQSSLVYSMTLS